LVSVIVPTYNRAALLPYLFDALARQLYPASRMELVVVDNSSSDDTEEVVNRWKGALPFPTHFHRHENRGPAASRNLGAAHARGQILAFTDSDCIPGNDWLRNAVRGFLGETGLVCGPITAAASSAPVGVLYTYLDETTAETGLYPTANFVVRRDAFEAVSGFDESFGLFPWGGLKGGEDTDLAWRIKRAGFGVRFLGDVSVRHQPTGLSPRSWLLRPVRVQILPQLIRSIPELRGTFLWRRFFVSRLHFQFHLAWIGVAVAAATRRRLPLLATVPWLLGIKPVVAQEARRGGPARALVSTGLITEGFVMHTLVLIIASIRHRRVVL
jgi:glycosyltransferase involved in cell wall biosynthesis